MKHCHFLLSKYLGAKPFIAFKGAESWILPLTEILTQSDLKGATQCFNHAGNIYMSPSSGKKDG